MSDPVPPQRTVASPADPHVSAATSDDETADVIPRSAPTVPKFGPSAVPGEVGTLGLYRVVKQLGAGGMGAVYLAVDPRLGRKLALKVMLPEYAADTAAKERFLREGRAAANISSDNVVVVYEADEREGVPYIAMQFLQGYPLNEYLKTKGAPPLPHVIRIARETALGLSAAHAIGLVHRDIKPANLWLEAPNGRVKVLDFGLAKPVGADAELTKSGAVVGTPAYMSPEQARGLKVDHRTDLFSLGSVLYRLCTGRTPFKGPNTMAVLMALGTDDPTPVRELNPQVPEELAELVHQLLAKKPDDRPPSATEVAKRLRAILDRLLVPPPAVPEAPPSAKDASVSLPLVVNPVPYQPPIVVPMQITLRPEDVFADLDATSSTSAPVPEPERKQAGGRGPMLAAVGAVLLAGVAVAVVVSQMGKKGEPAVENRTPAVPGPIDPKPPEPKVDPDRAAAEYVLSIGGTVRVNDETRDLKATKELPAGPLRLTACALPADRPGTDTELAHLAAGHPGVTAIDLSNTKVTDIGLTHLKGFPNLSSLNLINTPVTDAGLTHLRGCERLANLDLTDTCVTDVGLVNLKPGPNFTSLGLKNTSVTDAGLVHLKGCTGLTHLGLVNAKMTDAGLVHLAGLTQLSALQLGGKGITGEGLVHLKGCKALTRLDLIQAASSDDALKHLAAFPNLHTLNLTGTPVTATGLAHLKNVKRLTNLLLTSATFTDADLAPLKECHLAILNLSRTPVTDAGLVHLTDSADLQTLDLSDTAVGDAGLAHLKGCKFLRSLNLGGTKVTDAGLATLAGFERPVRVALQRTKVTAAGVAKLAKALPNCRIESDFGTFEPVADRTGAEWVLSIGGTVRVNGEERDLKAAAELPKDAFWLTAVNLASNPRATDAGLAALRGCKNLTTLDLYTTPVSDAGMVHLAESKGLTTLILTNTKVTDAGLAHFAGCNGLTSLLLTNTKVTDAGMVHFKDAKNLMVLNLTMTKVTDAGMVHFKDAKSLTQLHLYGTQVTDAGLAHFAGCNDLIYLHLADTRTTDAGLATFKGCQRLTVLVLSGTQVTDTGLAYFKDNKRLVSLKLVGCAGITDASVELLSRFEKLTELQLRGTKVTATGAERFQQALPKCKIDLEPPKK